MYRSIVAHHMAKRRHRFAAHFDVRASGTAFTNFCLAMRTNSLFDPGYTFSTRAVNGYETLSAMYTRNVVVSSKVTFRLSWPPPTNTTDPIVPLVLTLDESPLGTITGTSTYLYDLQELPGVKFKVFRAIPGEATSISLRYSAKKATGARSIAELMQNEDAMALYSADPITASFFRLGIWPQEASSTPYPLVHVECFMEFNAVWYRPIDAVLD